jgi:hypothetical protein
MPRKQKKSKTFDFHLQNEAEYFIFLIWAFVACMLFINVMK